MRSSEGGSGAASVTAGPPEAEDAPGEGWRIMVTGTVQGVGLRPWIARVARELGVTGKVRNDGRGVVVEAFGPRWALERLIERLRSPAPRAARVTALRWERCQLAPERELRIVPSERGGEVRMTLPPDLALCDACRADVLDPAGRRFRHPFASCTDCGPRLTVALALPYDRATTTMTGFPPCARCREEHDAPADRRYHAQGIACPSCGPRLALIDREGRPVEGDPVRETALALRAGRLVAVKAIGGYHLCCDATDESAVAELRLRKARERRPFALAARDLAQAAELVELDAVLEALLTSVERPIVLAPRRPGARVAPSVAPRCGKLGVLLPASALQELLLAEVERPLVMTSGNRSTSPTCVRDDEARDRLGGIADLFLTHDLPIAHRADDSVARVVAGAPLLVRRSRGHVPRAIELPWSLPRPVLACGGQLKNTFCIGVGDRAFLSAHVGDLEDPEGYASFAAAIAAMERLLGVAPDVVAYDLHPGYLSTRYALEREGALHVGVQHHHAHVASAAAEHGLEVPILGVAFDGAGWGNDGRSWGGEILRVHGAAMTRLATLRPLRLAGGEAAIRHPWRAALALVADAFGGALPATLPPPLARVPEAYRTAVHAMLERDVLAPAAHGAGRYFDAVAALLIDDPGFDAQLYEGELAGMLEELAADAPAAPYPHALERGEGLLRIDLRPAVRALLAELAEGAERAHVAAAFHETIAEATSDALRELARAHGPMPIVLTGGCFQNARLTEALLRRLPAPAHVHRRVPPGDGGLALGQLWVAGHRLRDEASESSGG